MRFESGDQAISSTLSFWSVSLRASPPTAGITKRFIGVFSSPRLEANASQFPSGDQRGVVSLRSPEVNCRGSADPSSGATQMAPRYSFASRSIEVTTNATREPSGEMRGSPALTSS